MQKNKIVTLQVYTHKIANTQMTNISMPIIAIDMVLSYYTNLLRATKQKNSVVFTTLFNKIL